MHILQNIKQFWRTLRLSFKNVFKFRQIAFQIRFFEVRKDKIGVFEVVIELFLYRILNSFEKSVKNLHFFLYNFIRFLFQIWKISLNFRNPGFF